MRQLPELGTTITWGHGGVCQVTRRTRDPQHPSSPGDQPAYNAARVTPRRQKACYQGLLNALPFAFAPCRSPPLSHTAPGLTLRPGCHQLQRRPPRHIPSCIRYLSLQHCRVMSARQKLLAESVNSNARNCCGPPPFQGVVKQQYLRKRSSRGRGTGAVTQGPRSDGAPVL